MKQPTLFLMLGYPGAGKTTASKIIHRLTGAEHLWADHERNQMFTNPTHTHQEHVKLYSVLNKRAEAMLRSGKSVIFDTNFNFYKDRENLRRIAKDAGAKVILVWVATPKEIARERATAHSLEGEHHRVWGNMSVEAFERIAGNLQPARDDEQPVKLDGIDMTDEVVAQKLQLL